jgi:hypothetical protein
VDDIIFMRHDFEQKKRFDALVYSYKKIRNKDWKEGKDKYQKKLSVCSLK